MLLLGYTFKMENFLRLKKELRVQLWHEVSQRVESYLSTVSNGAVSPTIDISEMEYKLNRYDFQQGKSLQEVLDFSEEILATQVHTPHPRYFGLFNPASTSMGIAADTLVAAYNPQLAAWSHAPFANETERYVIKQLGMRFGYTESDASGTFTSGGAEANHTALLAALIHKFPDFDNKGLRALPGQPVFYVSSQSHHSFHKAARFCGLGTNSVRQVPHDKNLKLDIEALEVLLKQDIENGFAPFMIVATGGSTNAGVIDDVNEISVLAKKYNCWCHLDAAWGGAAVLIPELRHLLSGSEQCDSITFDAHKWLSVPMGAGMLLTKHVDILNRTCHISAAYMPVDKDETRVQDPFTHSMQWSRRFIGLKVFMSLALSGWQGYAKTLAHQVAMGRLLRQGLLDHGWQIHNDTPLPVVCFSHPDMSSKNLEQLIVNIVESGEIWLSVTTLDSQKPVARACITNFLTQEEDIDFFLRILNKEKKNR